MRRFFPNSRQKMLLILLSNIGISFLLSLTIGCKQRSGDSNTQGADATQKVDAADSANAVDGRGDKWAARPLTAKQRQEYEELKKRAAEDTRTPAEKIGLDTCRHMYFPNEKAHYWGSGDGNCCLYQCPSGYYQTELEGTMCMKIDGSYYRPKCAHSR